MLFSILVPMYNVQEYARECIESILQQSCKDFEVIIVNDGSKDSTADIINEYAARDDRIVAVHKENGGVTSARNAAISRARGEYIITVDGDDWLEKNALECVEAALRRKKTDMVWFGHYRANNQMDKKKSTVTDKAEYLDAEQIHQRLVPYVFSSKSVTPNLWDKAFKKELYTRFCYLDERIVMGEDGAITYPCLYAAKSICMLPDELYNYRQSQNSLTRSRSKYLSWESAELRVVHYFHVLPKTDGVKKQIAYFTVRALFNVILSHMKHDPYAQVRRDSIKKLSQDELDQLIKLADCRGNLKMELAHFALKHRLFWLIKLYSALI